MMEENKSLRGLNSFGVDVSARRFAEFSDRAELTALLDSLPPGEKWMILGGGNNVLFTGDYHGTVLHPACRDIAQVSDDGRTVRVRAGAGVEWDDLVAWAVRNGLGGIENLSLIPGYVGAAPVQNIGAYGAEAKDTIESVECLLTDTRETVTLSNAECRFGYRDSIFKRELKGRAVILAVQFILARDPQFRLRYGDVEQQVEALGGVSLENIRRAVIAIRSSKLPDPRVLGNAGSFFKNPVVSQAQADFLTKKYPDMPRYAVGEGRVKLAAGWLIDRCGWRGSRLGPAGIHERQALVVVNHGGATGADIVRLARAVQQDVLERFGVTIDMEVNLI